MRILLRYALVFVWTANLASAQTTSVGTVAQLESAVANANSSGGNRTILVLDGSTVSLTSTGKWPILEITVDRQTFPQPAILVR